VFLGQIERFIRAFGNTRDELAAIRSLLRARRKALAKSGKRGRPHGSKDERMATAGQHDTFNTEPAKMHGHFVRDEHCAFRDTWIWWGDFEPLRKILLEGISIFIGGADKRELTVLRKDVARRARSRGIVKKRGHPSVTANDELLSRARLVAWRRIIEKKSTDAIAKELGISVIPASKMHAGNIQTVRGNLWLLQSYLAAIIWEAFPHGYVCPTGEYRHELMPGALENIYLQQLIEHRTGLPFRTHPGECKRIVTALSPRSRRAYSQLMERRFSYLSKKTSK
jgi:hypothetical protein